MNLNVQHLLFLNKTRYLLDFQLEEQYIKHMNNPVINTIKNRRSIREYTDQHITPEQLHTIIEAGFWAPSGLNNQPWRFVTITKDTIKKQLSSLTHYGRIIETSPALIAVYLDTQTMYDEVKDHQSAGACIQNMLLAAESIGLGGVWLGQILKNKSSVNAALELPDRFDLMAILAFGYPEHRNQSSTRKPINEFLIKEL